MKKAIPVIPNKIVSFNFRVSPYMWNKISLGSSISDTPAQLDQLAGENLYCFNTRNTVASKNPQLPGGKMTYEVEFQHYRQENSHRHSLSIAIQEKELPTISLPNIKMAKEVPFNWFSPAINTKEVPFNCISKAIQKKKMPRQQLQIDYHSTITTYITAYYTL